MEISDINLTENGDSFFGGAIYLSYNSGKIVIKNGRIFKNYSKLMAGGIFDYSSGQTILENLVLE